jgi:hypothetical protein
MFSPHVAFHQSKQGFEPIPPPDFSPTREDEPLGDITPRPSDAEFWG